MLIVVNTWKRPVLLAQTLASIRAAKSADSQIGVIDDATPDYTAPEGVDFNWQAPRHLGVGLARLWALERCNASTHDLFLLMDNDLLVRPGFDSEVVKLWERYRDRHVGCIASPYRSTSREHLVRDIDFGAYVFSPATAGAMLLLDRERLTHILKRMPRAFWTELWDWTLSGFINGCIKPHETYAFHVGYDADAYHANDPDHILHTGI